MEYLNDTTYKRGDDVRLELTVEAEKAKTDRGRGIRKDPRAFLGTRGYEIELWGEAPEIKGNEATIVLIGKIEQVADDTYEAREGVQGRIPGDTVRFEQICPVQRPLKVEGGANGNSDTLLS